MASALAVAAPHHTRALVLIAPTFDPSAIGASDRVLALPVIGRALTWLAFRTGGLVLRIPPLSRRILGDEVVRRITRGDVWRSFTAEQRRLVADAHRLEEQLGTIQ